MLAFAAGLPWVLVILLHREVTTGHPKPLQALYSKTWGPPFTCSGHTPLGRQRKRWRIASPAPLENSEARPRMVGPLEKGSLKIPKVFRDMDLFPN